MSRRKETDSREHQIDKIIVEYLEQRSGSEQNLCALRGHFLTRYPEFKEELMAFFKDEDVFRPQDSLRKFGDDFEVLGVIGESVGTVYLAFWRSQEKLVAIKTFNRDSVGTGQVGEVVRKEALRAASLRHANIVTVHQVAEHFFVMDYIEGETLAHVVHNGPLRELKMAAQYVKMIAQAIDYAHNHAPQKGILHCDLKPANILMDHDQRIYVTDFHQAKRIGENGRCLPYHPGIGTPEYMAPEQMTGDELTKATDIYGLGGILYALLTGSPPFEVQGKTWEEIKKMVCEESPVPPRARNPKVNEDLNAICLRCLNKNKDLRFESAYELAREIERCQAGEQTKTRPWGRLEATIRWCFRKPGPAALIPALILASILTVTLTLLTAKDRKAAQLQEALQSNGDAAKILAANALSEIRDLSRIVGKAARDLKLISGLASSEKALGDAPLFKRLASENNPLEQYVETLCSEGHLIFIQDCFVLDQHGNEVADYRIELEHGQQFGKHEKTLGDLSWRDYFKGAKAHIGLAAAYSVHIGKVYRSLTDHLSKLSISAPILDDHGKFLGVICIGVRNSSQLGLVIPDDHRHQVALIAPKDIDSQTETRPGQSVILFHPAYRPSDDTVSTQSPIPETQKWSHAKELNDSEQPPLRPREDYVDPVGSVQEKFRGRWIAGFAPVGNTGIVVVVQQRYDEAMKSDPSTRYLRVWTFGVLLLAISALFVRLWLRRARNQAGIAPADSHFARPDGSIPTSD